MGVISPSFTVVEANAESLLAGAGSQEELCGEPGWATPHPQALGLTLLCLAL